MFTIAEYLNIVLLCYPQPGMRVVEIDEKRDQQFSANFLSYVCTIFTEVHNKEEQLLQAKQKQNSGQFDADAFREAVTYAQVKTTLRDLLGFPRKQCHTDYQPFQSMRLKWTPVSLQNPITPYRETISYPPAKFIDIARMLIYFNGRKDFVQKKAILFAQGHAGDTLITDESFLIFWNMQLLRTKLSDTIALLRANDRHWQRFLKDPSYKYVKILAPEHERCELEKQMFAVFSV